MTAPQEPTTEELLAGDTETVVLHVVTREDAAALIGEDVSGAEL